MPRKFAWASLPDEQLLQLRLKDLGVRIRGTWLEGCLERLDDELTQRGIGIRPHAWLSDEWFSPDSTPGIAIPFYLAHPRLMRLERKTILEVEGGIAAGLPAHPAPRDRPRRPARLPAASPPPLAAATSGAPRSRYPRYYRPNPASRKYVQHLRLWYAQSHPDEDFAETFAVWLSPRSDWRKRYAGWPALKKLEYVDELMAEIAGEKPLLTCRARGRSPRPHRAHACGALRRKQAVYLVKPPHTYDRDLRRLFCDDPEDSEAPAASTFLRRNRAKIRRIVSHWTGEYQLTLDSLLDDMIDRCRELKLRAAGHEDQLRMDFTVLFTAKTVQSLYGTGRRKWFAL